MKKTIFLLALILVSPMVFAQDYSPADFDVDGDYSPMPVEDLSPADFNVELTADFSGVRIKGITAIPGNFAYGCQSLQTVVIPEGVTEIGEGAFSRCYALTSVTLPSTIRRIKGGSDWQISWTGGAFEDCSALTTLTIPDSLETIEFPPYNIREAQGLPGSNLRDNTAFTNCPKLSIAAQAGLRRRGYTGSF
jgi:hypothetical protein